MKRFRSILGFCLPLAAFAGLAWLVCQHRQGLWWDVAILQAVRTTHRPWLDRLVTGFTPLGIWWGVLPAALVMVGLLAYRGKWRSVLYVEIAFMGTAVLNFVAKLFFHRVRPHLWEDVPWMREYSFPSGHSMASLALVIAIVMLTWQSRWRPLAIVGGGAFVLAIGWTRLYLGVHYPSDIIGGWLLETAWMAMSVLLIQPPPFYQGDRPQLPEIPPPKPCN
ncbi:MAG TPA: phosphatase PAP2 family protein [Oscillatoriales cyanobacterium M59_W2019_021]|nr:MAG: phosphatase PAP2 family protein [Cyanobacteria bacterium J055]HIK33971.1 phosphatase PAP2 family protein [Oscillatoriales cyanobacterium M4454_W2019_049]HIK52890.1 phosphatase PAP2 family protein [Oscillatoriales cyanobacterium M59_W2019_021]